MMDRSRTEDRTENLFTTVYMQGPIKTTIDGVVGSLYTSVKATWTAYRGGQGAVVRLKVQAFDPYYKALLQSLR